LPDRQKNARRLIQINARSALRREIEGMETDLNAMDAPDTPPCPSCRQPMIFKRAVPRFAALPELRTYECKACGITFTAAIEPGEHADVAWIERAKSCGVA
jgi:hypothetical protein